MSEMLVGILGFVCIIAIVITLLKSKTLPSIAFITFPMILGVILVLSGYYTWDNTLQSSSRAAFPAPAPTASHCSYSASCCFGIMTTDAGMFDVIINNHAGPALTMCFDSDGGGCPHGRRPCEEEVEGTTSVITCMSGLISTFLPAVLGRHLPLVIGILSVPLALAFDTDSYLLRNASGHDRHRRGLRDPRRSRSPPRWQYRRNCATFISPMVPATLLGVGLADVDINQHIKSNFLWVPGVVPLSA